MNVQELFKQAEPDRVAEAYFLQHELFEPCEKDTLDEKIDITLHIKEQIREHIKKFATCDIKVEEPYTIFVAEYICEEYEDKGKTEVYLSSTSDKEAYEKIYGKADTWDNKEENYIHNYGIETCELEELAGYSIAEECVKTLGVTACCVEILFELFYFGYTEEARKRNIEEFCKELNEGIKDVEEGRTFSHDDVFAGLWEDMLDECENEDERQHMILKKEYEDKVHDIEYRYTQKVWEENARKDVDLIRREYLSRW